MNAYVGERVHQELWRQRIPQAQVCEAMGIARGTLHRKMRGDVTWSVADLVAVAQVINIPVSDLLPQTAAARWGGWGSNPRPTDLGSGRTFTRRAQLVHF